MERIRAALTKYHKLIIPEQEETFSPPMDIKELQKIAKQLKEDYLKADNNAEVLKNFVKIRVGEFSPGKRTFD